MADRSPPPPTPPGRRPPKRERTRARLIAATVEALGTMGLDAATVLEITKLADVSNGTFYLYFKDKAEAVDVAVLEVADRISRSIIEREREIPSPPARVAFALRQTIDALLADRRWLKAMLAAHAVLPEFRLRTRGYMLEALQDGIARGAFRLTPSEVQIESISAVFMTALRVHLEGAPEPDVTADCIELILRMLGVDAAEARLLSRADEPARTGAAHPGPPRG